MAKTAVLVIEDEPKVAASIQQWLEENGYVAEIAPDGAVGRHLALSQRFDLVLLDINLPFVNGLEVCRQIRQAQPNIPIILVTALESIEEKLSGFEAGADDYIVKPFDFRELLVRIKAVMKRKPINTEMEILQVADLEMNIDHKTVQRAGRPIELTAKEFSLLEYLVRLNGRVASRHEIAEAVWDINFDSGTNIVEVYINFLRKKIDRSFEPKLIHTKQGMGYFIKA
jgi:DNA-binding response OmpR family regulator